MKSSAVLGRLCWPQVADRAVTLVVPLGATEQHGPHLPLDTDTRIATAVASSAVDAMARADDDSTTLLAPALPYGASGEHEGFPGTVSVGLEVLELMLIEYGRSACRWAHRLVFVNGHGGNGRALVAAVRLLRHEGRDVAWFPCGSPGGDAHAGHAETSVLLHLSPNDVRVDEASAGNRSPIQTLLPALRSGGVKAVSENGVLGDPAGANDAAGARMVTAMVGDLLAGLGTWRIDEAGRLT